MPLDSSDRQAEAEVERASPEEEKTYNQVITALDQSSDMIVLFDPEDRIVFTNQAWREFNADVAWTTKPGTTFEEHIRALTEHGCVPNAVGQEEEWIARRLERHRNPIGPFELPTRGDKWISVDEQQLEDGSTILVIRDITARRNSERLIQIQNERFQAALSNMSQALCMFDGEQKLVVCNQRYASMYGLSPELVTPGTTFREILEFRTANEVFSGTTKEEYIQERLDAVQERTYSNKIQKLSDGRYIAIAHSPMSGGGWLATHEDVTERMGMERALQQSEAQLRAILDNSPFCVNLKDRNGYYLFANEHYRHWWDVKDEMVGKKIEDFSSDPARAEKVSRSEAKVLETGNPLHEEVTLRRPRDGQERDRLRVKFPVKNTNDEVTGVGTIAIDITDLKDAERAQKKSEELFLKAFDASPSPLSIADIEGRIFFVNDAWLRTFGFERDKVIGRTSGDLQLWNSNEDRHEFITHLRNSGALHGFETRFRTSQGNLIDVAISADIVSVQGDQRIFSNIIDVTKEKKIKKRLVEHRDLLQQKVEEATADLKSKAEELETALEKEKELNELQRQFVSMASHEFRTPLAIIDQSAQRLLRNVDKDVLTKETARTRIAKIRDAVTRMARLMESTLTAARLEEGKISISVEPCDIRKIVMDACARQQEISAAHVINCDLNDLPETIEADSGALDQMLGNLLSNAVKYSPGASAIEVCGNTLGKDVVIAVTDHGLGMDEEDIPNLFTRFFRAKTSMGIAGTGIGLHTIKVLAEMHEGSIEVKSQKDIGSTFTVRLPIDGPTMQDIPGQEYTAA